MDPGPRSTPRSILKKPGSRDASPRGILKRTVVAEVHEEPKSQQRSEYLSPPRERQNQPTDMTSSPILAGILSGSDYVAPTGHHCKVHGYIVQPGQKCKVYCPHMSRDRDVNLGRSPRKSRKTTLSPYRVAAIQETDPNQCDFHCSGLHPELFDDDIPSTSQLHRSRMMIPGRAQQTAKTTKPQSVEHQQQQQQKQQEQKQREVQKKTEDEKMKTRSRSEQLKQKPLPTLLEPAISSPNLSTTPSKDSTPTKSTSQASTSSGERRSTRKKNLRFDSFNF